MSTRAARILLLAALLPSAQGQEIWRQVTESGDIRYADRPFAGAEPVALSGSSRWAPAAPPPPAGEATQRKQNAPPPGAAPGSGPELTLLQPAAEQTVWGVGGELTVSLAGDLELPPGGRLLLELDGAEAGWRGNPPEVILNSVWRGEHRLRARLVDAEGRELASTPEIRFYKREPAVANPPATSP